MPDAQSNAQQLFDEIINNENPGAFLESMVDSDPKTYETEWLEFKQFFKYEDKQIEDNKIKEILSEAVSGFANTGGGVLIWGIKANPIKVEDQWIDYAHQLSLVENPSGFRQRLINFMQHAVDPPVSGTDFREIPSSSEPDKGFVVCLIPESSFKPHRALRPNSQPYFMRVNDRFEVMPHPILRRMFYPEFHSRYEVIVKSDRNEIMGDVFAEFHVTITNTGTATASEMFIRLISDRHLNRFRPSGASTIRQVAVIEPTTSVDEAKIQVRMVKPIHPHHTVSVFHFNMPLKDDEAWGNIKLDFYFFVRDQQPQIATIDFCQNDILEREKKIAVTQELEYK